MRARDARNTEASVTLKNFVALSRGVNFQNK